MSYWRGLLGLLLGGAMIAVMIAPERMFGEAIPFTLRAIFIVFGFILLTGGVYTIDMARRSKRVHKSVAPVPGMVDVLPMEDVDDTTYTVRITLRGDKSAWLAPCAPSGPVRSVAGKGAQAAQVWLDPDTGAPLIAQMGGVKLKLLPVTRKEEIA